MPSLRPAAVRAVRRCSSRRQVPGLFEKLVRRGYAVASDYLHNRARLYHVHQGAVPRHASVQQIQRYLNVTDEELRKGLEVSWNRRPLRAVAGGQKCVTNCHTCVTRGSKNWRARQDSNLRPPA